MIEYIRGGVAELSPTQAVIDAGGVGYALAISLNTYTALQGKEEARLYVFEAIREDAYQLYGFATKQERVLFALLVSISGVGGATARMVLSAFTPVDLARVVMAEDSRSLTSVKGIGSKAAGRIIVELKDKVQDLYADVSGTSDGSEGNGVQSALRSPVVSEAVEALTVLGFPPASAHKAVVQIVKHDAGITVEEIIKRALKML